MRKKLIWLLGSCLMVLTLLAAACAPAEEAPTGQTPAEKTPAAEKEVTPAEKETAAPTTGKDMVRVSWKNGEGVTIEKEIERPRYGGTARYSITQTLCKGWDPGVPGNSPWGVAGYSITQDKLVQGEWPRGPVVTGEVDWLASGWMREDFSYGALAESWEFVDDSTAIFHIRKGVHWQDKAPVNGREFNAHDVVWSLQREYWEVKSSVMYGMALGGSEPVDIYAEDDWTVVLKSAPGQIGKTWEYVADWSFMVPREPVEKYGDMNDWENVVGTGPFILSDYVAGSSITMERNPNYWMPDPLIPENRLPYLDVLRALIIDDTSTRMAAIRTGKIDWVHGQVPEAALGVINTQPNIIYKHYPMTGFAPLGFRLDKPELPFDDIRVRRALLMGINQQEIIDTYWDGQGQIHPQIVSNEKMFKDVWTPLDQLPPSADGFDNRKMFEYHPEEARQLLADAGYPNGFKFSVVMRDSPQHKDYAAMAKAYWEKIGVELNLDVKETGAFLTYYRQKTYPEAVFGGRWTGEPYSMFCVRTGNMYNFSPGPDSAIFDEYYHQLTALYWKPKERDELMKEVNLVIIDYAPYYVTPTGSYYAMWWPWVKNFDGINSLGLGGYFFQKYMWLDLELKESMGY